MKQKQAIHVECEICGVVSHTVTQRAAGILLAFHFYDQHIDKFWEYYNDFLKTQGEMFEGDKR